MSAEQTEGRTKQTLKVVKDLLEKAEVSTQKSLGKAAPAVKSIDASLEAAARGFNSTLQTIDGATVEDQVMLLRAYPMIPPAGIVY